MENTFFSLIPGIPNNFTLDQIMAIFMLGLMRIGPIVAFAPFLGAKVPNLTKMGLACTINILLLPVMISTLHGKIELSDKFLIYGLKELAIGGILGFLSTLPFHFVQSSGILIDHSRGSSSLMVTDPLMQSQVSPLSILYNYLLVVIFFEVKGPFIFLDGLLDSYKILPMDIFLKSSFFIKDSNFWEFIFAIMTKTLVISIQLSAPSLVAILMAEMFLGIANRLAPNVQIVFLGMPIKSLLAIGLLCAAWFVIVQQLGRISISWVKEIDRMISFFST